ncbi:MAG: hypothetical protein K0B14_14130, partial [Anaerolineaceae bacterium]|nr:hypothetical protein [Anaerolineaceae bacterium]
FARKYLPEKTRIDKDKRALDLVNRDDFKAILDDSGLSAEQKVRLLGRYSHNTPNLILSSQVTDFEKILETPTLWAELKWAARHEQVIHLDDLLLRRTRIGSLLPQGSLPIMQQIRKICQPQLDWDDARWQAEVLAYQQLYAQSYSLPQPLTA